MSDEEPHGKDFIPKKVQIRHTADPMIKSQPWERQGWLCGIEHELVSRSDPSAKPTPRQLCPGETIFPWVPETDPREHMLSRHRLATDVLKFMDLSHNSCTN